MQQTPESQFVKNLDRFDMILQADQYEKGNLPYISPVQYTCSVHGLNICGCANDANLGVSFLKVWAHVILCNRLYDTADVT